MTARLDVFYADQDSSVRYQFLVTLLNAIADPLFVKDREHRWIFLNDAYCSFYGAKRESLIGKSDYDTFTKAQADVFWEKDSAVYETGKPNENEELFTDSAGVTHTIITTKARYFDHAGNIFLVGTIRDISAKKEAERQRIEKEAAETASEMKSEFLDVAAHELRTPLTPLVLLLEMAVRQTTESKPIPKSHLERALKQVGRLKRLVDDLLDASRLEHGRLVLSRIEMDLNPIVKECVADSRSRAPDRVIRLETDSAEPIPVFIDPDRIYQVISNLIDNAIKHTPKETPIRIRSILAPPFARVEVIDEGPGISKDLEAQIFTRFVRVTGLSNSLQSGLGLGLYICRQIALLHGGLIGFRSEPGKGSLFFLELPLMEAFS